MNGTSLINIDNLLEDLHDVAADKRASAALGLRTLDHSNEQIVTALEEVAISDSNVNVAQAARQTLDTPVHQEVLKTLGGAHEHFVQHELTSSKQIIPVSLPKFWIGILVGAFMLLFAFAIGMANRVNSTDITLALSWVYVLIYIGMFIFWCTCVYRLHKAVQQNLAPNYPITPGKAVGYHFIPFYNLYWYFKWPIEMVNFINSKITSSRIRGWLVGLILLAGFGLIGWDVVVGLIVIFCVGFYLTQLIGEVMDQNLSPGELPAQGRHSRAVDTLIIILLIAMGLTFLLLGIYQVVNSQKIASGGSPGTMALIGFWNIFASAVNLSMIRYVLKHYIPLVKYITWLAILGSILGIIQLVSGVWLQIFFIPIYLVLGVLVQVNRKSYSVPVPSKKINMQIEESVSQETENDKED